jgi:hypothetical protein
MIKNTLSSKQGEISAKVEKCMKESGYW